MGISDYLIYVLMQASVSTFFFFLPSLLSSDFWNKVSSIKAVKKTSVAGLFLLPPEKIAVCVYSLFALC